jgi:hypothetical protein
MISGSLTRILASSGFVVGRPPALTFKVWFRLRCKGFGVGDTQLPNPSGVDLAV